MSFLCQDPTHAEPFACHCQAEGGWLCEFYRNLQDLVVRLEQADATLRAEAEKGFRVPHLRSKAEGVRLALSYVEEALR